MIRRPPRSTLFPTRRSSDLNNREHFKQITTPKTQTSSIDPRHFNAILSEPFRPQLHPLSNLLNLRSEEHTSELQSLAYLVCRLLLEKKKKLILHTTSRYSTI